MRGVPGPCITGKAYGFHMTTLTELDFDHHAHSAQRLDASGFDVAEDPSVRRQGALAMLAKFAQETTSTRQLFVEAAVLAARTLESDRFVAALLQGETSTIVALSGQRPSVRAEVELAETTFDREDLRYLVSQSLHAAEPLIIGDLAAAGQSSDPLLKSWPAGSAMICPIEYAGHQYGAIGVVTGEPRRAELEDVLFLQSLSLLLGPTVAYQRTEAVLAKHSAMLKATIDSLDSMVLVLSAEGKIIRLNQACQARTGFTVEDLKHRHFWGAYLLPEEVSIAQEAFHKLRRGESPVKCEMFLLTKSGQRRRVAWSFTVLPQLDEHTTSYVASGIDITEQHEALANLERAEANVSRMSARENGDGLPDGRAGHDQPPIPRNRRRSLRKEFPYIQLVGPMRAGKLPHADEFKEVRCRDISPTGFSYITKSPPDYQELVVALGAYPSQLYLTAQIMHVNRYRQEEQDLMLVGCAYTSRVHL